MMGVNSFIFVVDLITSQLFFGLNIFEVDGGEFWSTNVIEIVLARRNALEFFQLFDRMVVKS
jgi:hypothetical protein